jgi:hypothetical protein
VRTCSGLNSAPRSVVGTQTESRDPGELVLYPPMCKPGEHKTIFPHDKETMKAMWKKVAISVGMNVRV